MSWQAVQWALRGADVRSSAEVAVLVVLADFADASGEGAWPSRARIAEEARVDVRTVGKVLRVLSGRGVIRRGDQSLALCGRRGRPPVVWDLVMAGVSPAVDSGAAGPVFDGDKGAQGHIIDQKIGADVPFTGDDKGASGPLSRGIKGSSGQNKGAHGPMIHQGSTTSECVGADGDRTGGGQPPPDRHTHTGPAHEAGDGACGCAAAHPEPIEPQQLLRDMGLNRVPTPVRMRLRSAVVDLIEDGMDRPVIVEALHRWRDRPGSCIGLLPLLASDVLLERGEGGPSAESEAARRRRERLECPHCDEYGWLLDPATGNAFDPMIRCRHDGTIPEVVAR